MTALLLTPVRRWGLYVAAGVTALFLAQWQQGFSHAFFRFIPDGFQAIVLAICIHRFARGATNFGNLRFSVVFFASVACFVPLTQLSLWFVSNRSAADFWMLWRWLSLTNIVTLLSFVPFFLCLITHLPFWRQRISVKRFIEMMFLTLGILSTDLFVFEGRTAGTGNLPILLYAPLPFLLWSSVRFGPGGASASLMVLALLSTWGASHGYGPFVTPSSTENVLSLQVFLIVIALPLMFLAALIEERRKAERIRHDSESQFRQVLENVRLIAVIIDTQGRVKFCNDFLLTLTGQQRKDVIGVDWFALFLAPKDQKIVREFFLTGVASGTMMPYWENAVVTKSGEHRMISWSNTLTRNADGVIIGATSLGEDITERRKSEERTLWLAYHDGLTGLPNRSLFLDRLGQALAAAERNNTVGAILFLDLNRFKHINDTLGHTVGDLLLCEVATRLSGCLRDVDTLARMGGDEFTLLLPDLAHPEDAARVAQRVLDSIRQPFIIEGNELFVTGSIGISLFLSDGRDSTALLQNADVAMYRAKEQKQGHYALYTESMNERALERLVLENNLRKAIDRNEIVVYYQPQICMKTGDIVGVEALIRWEHPDLGLLMPAHFISLAEETGLILEMGDWVMRAACLQAAIWHKNGHRITVAVNLSARQFCQKGLVDTVQSILNETGLAAEYLDLELTESVLMHDRDEAIQTLGRLKRLGVHLSVDDFGTGYSSLAYLRSFPIDVIKVDRMFVAGLADDKTDQAVVCALVTLAHALNLQVIAEGVETHEQRQYLRTAGCDVMQGYLFSRPIPSNEVEKFFARSYAVV